MSTVKTLKSDVHSKLPTNYCQTASTIWASSMFDDLDDRTSMFTSRSSHLREKCSLSFCRVHEHNTHNNLIHSLTTALCTLLSLSWSWRAKLQSLPCLQTLHFYFHKFFFLPNLLFKSLKIWNMEWFFFLLVCYATLYAMILKYASMKLEGS